MVSVIVTAVVGVPTVALAGPLTTPPVAERSGTPRVVDTIHLRRVLAGGPVAVDPLLGRLYVADVDNSKIQVVDVHSDKVVAVTHGGCCGHFALATDPLRQTLYAVGIDDLPAVIDEQTNHRTGFLSFTGGFPGDAPFAVATNPRTGKVYVSSGSDNVIEVYDATTHAVTGKLRVGGGAYGMATDPAANRLYVTDPLHRLVQVVDGTTDRVIGHIQLAAAAQDSPTIAVDPLLRTLYVTNAAEGTLTVVDTATDRVTATVRVGAAPDAVAVDPVRHRVYVANYGGSSVTVIDGVGNRVIATLALGGHPLFVASDPIRGTAYVSNAGGTVSVIR
ncbi:MAG: YncE family protein [Lapillicoccus sp.]